MTTSALPASPAAFAKATWDDVLPYYEELAERQLDESTVETGSGRGPGWRSWSPRRRRRP